jgi:hypothetical protein
VKYKVFNQADDSFPNMNQIENHAENHAENQQLIELIVIFIT